MTANEENLILLGIIFLMLTAHVFYQLGVREGRKQAPSEAINMAVNHILADVAKAFFPGDQEGRKKVIDRLSEMQRGSR
jgi:hypothetical protein